MTERRHAGLGIQAMPAEADDEHGELLKRRAEGASPLLAARDAGATRIRPVLMTALAMIIGMIPMALGLGEGAEQNAPLGRAVIGGLLFATVSTLLFVPVVFASVHERLLRRQAARHSTPLSAHPQET